MLLRHGAALLGSRVCTGVHRCARHEQSISQAGPTEGRGLQSQTPCSRKTRHT